MGLFEERFLGSTLGINAAVTNSTDPINPSWALSHLYERISDMDFSRHILETHVNELRVVPVPQCGWSDLGTPHRVIERVNMLSGTLFNSKNNRSKKAVLDLRDAVVKEESRTSATQTFV